jgi:rRNA small subunit pseudouridine methyltransferase Nep1
MFHLIMAESALELVPHEIKGHPAVKNQARRSGKRPSEEVLDGTFHHSAMRKLTDGETRGRPDIVHLSLLVAQGSILNREGHLRTYVHTLNDELIEVNPSTRLPRNLERFKGILAQLLLKGEIKGRVEEEGGTVTELLRMTRAMTLEKVLNKIAPDKVYAFEEGKEIMTLNKALKKDGITAKELESSNIALIVGAFPHGGFRNDLSRMADRVLSIYGDTLELWTVIATIITDAERLIGLHKGDV